MGVLEKLTITDFAVARSVVVEPGHGLNVFTGETGAGKSLVVDALTFLFGGRRGREVIATGAERATVTAILNVDGQSVTLERSVGLSGRSASRVDGAAATVDEVRRRFGDLVDIHGQSEQLAVLRPSVQLTILDAYAGLTDQRDAVGATVRDLRDVRRQIEALARDTRERERLIDQLRYEVEEIEAAGLEPGEDESLREEQRRLSSSGRLMEAAAEAMAALEAAPIGELARAVADIAGRDAAAAPLLESATAIESSADDLARMLRQYADAIEEDPERLAAVAERLDRIARLTRKYGESVDDVIAYGAEAARRLASLTDASQSAEELAAREQSLLLTLARQAGELSAARRAHAGRLVRAIASELEHLGMPGASLSVGFGCDEDPRGPYLRLPEYEVVITERMPDTPYDELPCAFSETGVDRVEFMASFNPGESPRPLGAVASGGETSRFLLALTSVLGAVGPSRLVVLDEVDEGVGGRAGALVGEALARLAESRQVLCITHLPHVAAYAARHFVVSKQSDTTRTWSDIQAVEGEALRDELADMLGGVTDANRAAAEGLIAASVAR
jgi:DNA repair protein RecN (Recombination protein N)